MVCQLVIRDNHIPSQDIKLGLMFRGMFCGVGFVGVGFVGFVGGFMVKYV